MTQKRAAIYCRVSTEDQKDKGFSLSGQLRENQEKAAQLGYSVVAEFAEDYSGATPLAERPEGKKLNEMVKRGEVDAVIIYKVTRLGRDIVDVLSVIRSWLKAGLEIFIGDVGKVDNENDINVVIRAWQGREEWGIIRERSMEGKRNKALKGKVVGHRPPFGYHHVRNEHGKVESLEPEESEAGVVRLIYHWYVNGDETGKRLSGNEIAFKLASMGSPTRGELRNGYNRRRAPNMWHSFQVLEVLSKEIYAGIWRFGVRIGASRNTYPEDEQIIVKIPAIIDQETWLKAQELRGQNKALSRRNLKHEYLLRGLIRCGCGCGAAYCGEFFSNHRYYTSAWKNNHHPGIEQRKCYQRSIRADAIEADIWESIASLFNDLNRFENLLRIAQQEEMDALDPKSEELATIESLIADAQKQATEIGQALKRAKGIVGDTLEHEMEEIDNRYQALSNRREKLKYELENQKLTENVIDETLIWADDVRRGIANPDYETKRRTMETLKIQVTALDGRFTVKSLLGEWSGEIRKLPKVGAVQGLHLSGISPP